jgi:two-component system, sensor histidine kinase
MNDDEEQRLAALHASGLLDSPPDARYDDIVEIASLACGTPVALVSLVDRHRQWFKAKRNLAIDETPRENAFCSHAIHSPGGALYEVPDAAAHPIFKTSELVTQAPHIRFYAGAPLVTAGGALGTLCVIDYVPHELRPEQRAILAALARQVVHLIELDQKRRDAEQAQAALSAAERHKSEFVSMLSHELRTPLTSIRGAFGLLEGGVLGPLSDEARELVEIARRDTDRLVRLINDLLDVERLERGNIRLQVRPVRVDEVVARAVATLGPVAQEAKVQVRISASPVRAFADSDRLMQICVNLIGNAIKFSPEGRVVWVRAMRTADGVARVEVEDAGPGIPEAQRSRLFKPFVQLDGGDARGRPGAGLGLAISKSLVENMDGTIGVYSTERVGSVFWFQLPLSGPTETAAAQPAPAKPRVLVVGPGEMLARSAAALDVESYAITTEAVPDNALTLARSGEFDVIVVDADSDARRLLAGQAEAPLLVVGRTHGHEVDTLPPTGAGTGPRTLHVPNVGDSARVSLAMQWLSSSASAPRILMLDDDPSFVTVSAIQLRELNAITIAATNLDDAVRIAAGGRPSLVILEAGFGGREKEAELFVQRLRERGLRVSLLVYSTEEVSDEMRSAFGQSSVFLTKSLSSSGELLGAVRGILAATPPRGTR